MNIPHSRPTLGSQEAQAVARVVRSGYITQGKEVALFEKEMARYLGVKGSVAVSSGFAALSLALRALNMRESDHVLFPSYACTALYHACRFASAKTRLLDIEPNDFNITSSNLDRQITSQTKAIIVTHAFGAPSNLTPFIKTGIPVIEDIAQALGGSDNKKRKLGSLGRIGILSFYATKLMTTGEGGMVVSHDRSILDRIREIRDYDEKSPTIERFNFKMTDIQAAMGRIQLRKLDHFIKQRRKIADDYRKNFQNSSSFSLPFSHPGHVYHRFIIRSHTQNVDSVIKKFSKRRISVRRPVLHPLHWDIPQNEAFPITETAWETAVSLPIYPSLTTQEKNHVIRSVHEIFG